MVSSSVISSVTISYRDTITPPSSAPPPPCTPVRSMPAVAPSMMRSACWVMQLVSAVCRPSPAAARHSSASAATTYVYVGPHKQISRQNVRAPGGCILASTLVQNDTAGRNPTQINPLKATTRVCGRIKVAILGRISLASCLIRKCFILQHCTITTCLFFRTCHVYFFESEVGINLARRRRRLRPSGLEPRVPSGCHECW